MKPRIRKFSTRAGIIWVCLYGHTIPGRGDTPTRAYHDWRFNNRFYLNFTRAAQKGGV